MGCAADTRLALEGVGIQRAPAVADEAEDGEVGEPHKEWVCCVAVRASWAFHDDLGMFGNLGKLVGCGRDGRSSPHEAGPVPRSH